MVPDVVYSRMYGSLAENRRGPPWAGPRDGKRGDDYQQRDRDQGRATSVTLFRVAERINLLRSPPVGSVAGGQMEVGQRASPIEALSA